MGSRGSRLLLLVRVEDRSLTVGLVGSLDRLVGVDSLPLWEKEMWSAGK